MAVALHMAGSGQRCQSKILLHGNAGLGGEIFGDNEVFIAAGGRIPFSCAHHVENGAVKPLAGFRRDAVIAKRPCHRKDADMAVGFINRDRFAGGDGVDRLLQRLRPCDGLLQIER